MAKKRLDAVLEKWCTGADVIDAFEDAKLGNIDIYADSCNIFNYRSIIRDGKRLILLPDGKRWKIVGITEV